MKYSVYMSWAKYHAAARYNLANSGILGCQTSDLPLTIDDVPINGSNHEGYTPLKEAIAAHYGVVPEMVMTAQGTSMANFLALATVIERGDEVLIEQPTYEPILAAASYLGAKIKRFSRHFSDGYQADLVELRRLVTPQTRLIIVTSPHNPSGVVLDQESLIEIGEIANAAGARVLVDEVYRDILFEDAPVTAARLGSQFIATASLTKSYGLSGLRCGWILCEPALAERMRRLNDIFGAVGAMPSEALAVKAFQHLDLLEARTRAIIEPNIKQTHEFLERHRDLLDYVAPPRSMIVFPRLKFADDSELLHDRLREFETSIVPGKYFESPSHFRLGFAVKPEDVAVGLDHLSRVLRSLQD
jgi:aspartate/methionine/tyrosine aminotransferase